MWKYWWQENGSPIEIAGCSGPLALFPRAQRTERMGGKREAYLFGDKQEGDKSGEEVAGKWRQGGVREGGRQEEKEDGKWR